MSEDAMSEFAEALHDLCEKFRNDLEITEAIYVGVSFFSAISYDCAPDHEMARGLIDHAANDGKKMSEGADAETIRH